ncbi:hypothetical protein ACVIOG_003891 [Rhizobium leguminosarum]
MQTPRRRHGQSHDLADHRSEATECQTFFHRRQDILFPVRLAEDDAIGMEACLGDRRKKQIGSGQAPKDFAFRSGGYSGNHQRGGRAVNGACPAAGELMQRTADQPAAGERLIDFRNTEREDGRLATNPSLEMRDALPQLGNDGVGAHLGPRPILITYVSYLAESDYVLSLFPISM